MEPGQEVARLAEEIERVLIGGDLSKLNPEQRVTYYKNVCESMGLNPLTRPLEYIMLNGKLTLYANKNCGEQLRRVHGVSIYKLERDGGAETYDVTAYARNGQGREDASLGSVNIKGLAGEALSNAKMKAETKAKRRVTLSLCGLGMLDETEVESIPGAVRVVPPEPIQATKPAIQDRPTVEVPVVTQTLTDVLAPPPANVHPFVQVTPSTQASFIKEFEAAAGAADTYLQLAALCCQNYGIAAKLNIEEQMVKLKRMAFGRLMIARGEAEPLIAVPDTVPGDLYLEFYALDEVGLKQAVPGMTTVFHLAKDVMKQRGVEAEWKAYAGALKKEVLSRPQEFTL